MKKIELVNLYEILRKLDAKNIDSEVRAKVLANTIAGKKAASEVEEAKKTVIEGATEEEKEASQLVQELREKGKDYELTDSDKKAIELVNAWNKTFAEAISAELNTEVDVELKKLSTEELNKLADGNSLTMDELVLLSELMVA